ncbi:MAG: NAD-dependent DNA ligase LigA [Planctomycetaceae bacterium]
MDASPAEEVTWLRNEIERHNRLYYVEARKEISDLEFDLLLKRLEALEQENPELDIPESPTHKVGGEPIAGFVTVPHRIPMLSIDNVYDADALKEFDERVRKLLNVEQVEYSVEYKIDGVAMALVYERGHLVQALTRGDGANGDDITHNARTVGGVPLRLTSDQPPELIEIRGEAYISNTDFAHLRKEQEARGDEPYANPRNTTAGALKLLDPKLCAARRVRFLAHGIGAAEGVEFATHLDFLKSVRDFGIPVTPNVEARLGIDATMELTQRMMDGLHTLDVEVDGLVVKVNQFSQRVELGNTSKAPRWIIAYKWERYEGVTQVESIEVQVGKTGTLTPVANLTPVLIAGTTVSRASLHNRDELQRLGLKIGDTVIVEKAGKIIPHVLRVEEHLRTGAEVDFQFPETCPNCQLPVVQDAGGVYVRCLNPSCPARLREGLRFFASRRAMDIEGLGTKLIEQLIDARLLTSFADVFRLHQRREELLALERLGAKSVDNLLAGIEASRSRPVWRLLTALNIQHVGQTVSRLLAARFGSVTRIAEQSVESLSEIDGVGTVIAHAVHEFFHSVAGQQTIAELTELDVNMGTPTVDPQATTPSAMLTAPGERTLFDGDVAGESSALAGDATPVAPVGSLTGKTIVVTGTLKSFSRDSIEEFIREHGGKPSGSVSKKTDFLVVGENAGSKLDKAKELGIEILTEAELIERVKS